MMYYCMNSKLFIKINYYLNLLMMKIKLLVVLMALISFSSCKKKETTSLELDKSNTITLSGKVILTSSEGFTIPEETQVEIAVANEYYGADGNNAKGDQIYYAPIADDGTYTFDLPLPNKTDASKTIGVEFYLPTIFSPSDIVFSSETIPKDIKFTDIEFRLDLEYSHKKGTEDGNVEITEGVVSASNSVKLPTDIIITGVTDEDKTHSSTVNKNGEYELVYINTESMDNSDLAISPDFFTSEDGFTYFAERSSEDFTYKQRTPIVSASSVKYNDDTKEIVLPENAPLSIEFKDPESSMTKQLTASINEDNIMIFQVPDSFYKKNDTSRSIDFTITYNRTGIDYSYSSSIRMDELNKNLGSITLN